MENWKLEAELSQGLGCTEWISAEVQTTKKSYRFSTSDQSFIRSRDHILIDVAVIGSGVLITSKSDDRRKLSVALSPKLLSEIIIAYGALAAKAGEDFPFAEAARALMRAQTSIVNREKPAP
ncbi:MAG TPA: hypothetical protein VL133_17105 [Devosia sp.]|nr:hypothetical protein [Devosia sp.]